MSIITTRRIILASSSPRRRVLLQQLGLSFEVKKNDVQEIIDLTKTARENVLRLSYLKSEQAAASIDDGIVIGADTLVVLDQHFLGKPNNGGEAEAMLRQLSGREHNVYTGFTIFNKPDGKYCSDVEVTTVKFRVLEDEEIRNYVRSGRPLD